MWKLNIINTTIQIEQQAADFTCNSKQQWFNIHSNRLTVESVEAYLGRICIQAGNAVCTAHRHTTQQSNIFIRCYIQNFSKQRTMLCQHFY